MASGREEGEGLGGGCGHEVWQTTATQDREVEREGEREKGKDREGADREKEMVRWTRNEVGFTEKLMGGEKGELCV